MKDEEHNPDLITGRVSESFVLSNLELDDPTNLKTSKEATHCKQNRSKK